jgi:thiol:disulfide interchange protein DsbD
MSPETLGALLGPDGQVGLAGALLLGLSMGLTACTVSCLPFMATWALGRAGSRRETLLHTGAFILGRVLAYAALGALAGQLGQWLLDALDSPLGLRAIGLASLFAGLWLMASEPRAAPAPAATQPVHFHPRPGRAPARCASTRLGAAPPLLMGAALSLSPCAPLGWLVGICAASGSLADGLGHGLAFGLGAGVTPLLLLVPAFGLLGRRMVSERAWLGLWLRLAAGGVLVFLGAQRLFLPAG